MIDFRLRFDLGAVGHWADRYMDQQSPKEREAERELVEELSPAVQDCGYYDKRALEQFAHWKSPRIVHHIEKNGTQFVQEITRLALLSTNERVRIEVPTVLCGVLYPMSSVLLHFAFPDRYPILDFRALWSLGVVSSKHDFQLWNDYACCCRGLARSAGVSLRTLDRALWQFSNEHQDKANEPPANRPLPAPWDAPAVSEGMELAFASERTWRDRMWLRPNATLGEFDDSSGYALTIDGYEYAVKVWGLGDPTDGSGADRILSHESNSGEWAGPFEDLRCCLFFLQRGIKWSEASASADDWRRKFERCHAAVCNAWEREAPDHLEEVRSAAESRA